MLKVRIIPCLDVKDGRVVKGINFEGLRDAGDPVEQAIVYDKAGADKVSINTAAVSRPEFVREAAEKFGSQCIVAAIDAKSVGNGRYEIFTHGGRKATGIDAVEHAKKLVGYGAGEVLLTSMDRDGVKSGYDLELTRAVSDAVEVPVIASGGVGNTQDLVDGVRRGHASAVLAASIFHFGEVSISEAKAALKAAGLPIRPI